MLWRFATLAFGALAVAIQRRGTEKVFPSFTRRAESAFAAFGLAQFIRPGVVANGGALDDQLRDPVARVEAYRSGAGVDDHRHQLAAKIRIHYAGERVNAVARRQSRTGRDAAIPAWGDLDNQSRRHGFSFARSEREGFETA